MTQIFAGRHAAEVDAPLAVFLIGMRVNRALAIHKWLPTFAAMAPMLTMLFRNPEKGLLGSHTWLGWRGVMLVQYWRSFEHLERFAHSKEDPHAEAMRQFFRRVGGDGSVGIWHETYLVEPGGAEAIYGNMPRFGLALAAGHAPVAKERAAARQRLGRPDGERAARV
jgi:hypothetical protein